MPSNLIKRLTDQANNEILLNNVNLEEELDSSSLQFIKNKARTRAIKLFSITNCKIGSISDVCLDKVTEIISDVKPENISLSNNCLYLLGSKIKVILNSLLHQEIQEIQLGGNGLGKIILIHPDIVDFLKSKTLRFLDLRDNNITDEMIGTLVTNSRIEFLNLGTNPLTSLSIPHLKKNKFFLQIILYNTNIDSINELQDVWEQNKIAKIQRYINEVISVSLESMKRNSHFNKVPLKILIEIVHHLGIESGIQDSKDYSINIMDEVLNGQSPQQVRAKFCKDAQKSLKIQSLPFFARENRNPPIKEEKFLRSRLKNSI